jgi:hypothetical protein
MVGWVTLRSAGAHGVRNKPAACRWLRSSSLKLLIKAVLLCNRYIGNLRFIGRCPWRRTRCFGITDENRAAEPAGRSLLEPYSRVSSGPLAQLRLADVVDVDPGAADVPLVDLDLTQMRGGMGATPR